VRAARELNVCSVQWCLNPAAPRRHACQLHCDHPTLNAREERDAYFARLRGKGMGGGV
jgi:hypothetical protein